MSWVRKLIRRFLLDLRGRCIVCGAGLGPWVRRNEGPGYCSIECACYDGVFSVRAGELKKPTIWINKNSSTTFSSLTDLDGSKTASPVGPPRSSPSSPA